MERKNWIIWSKLNNSVSNLIWILVQNRGLLFQINAEFLCSFQILALIIVNLLLEVRIDLELLYALLLQPLIPSIDVWIQTNLLLSSFAQVLPWAGFSFLEDRVGLSIHLSSSSGLLLEHEQEAGVELFQLSVWSKCVYSAVKGDFTGLLRPTARQELNLIAFIRMLSFKHCVHPLALAEDGVALFLIRTYLSFTRSPWKLLCKLIIFHFIIWFIMHIHIANSVVKVMLIAWCHQVQSVCWKVSWCRLLNRYGRFCHIGNVDMVTGTLVVIH